MGEALREIVTLADAVDEQGLLERLVEVAALVCGARFSVALVLGPDGTTSAIAHRGMSAGDVARLPHLPRGLGLVGHVLAGNVVRIADLAQHPLSVGFPPGHVEMEGLLAVPITVARRVLGGIWLTRSPGQPEFTASDEACAVAVARQAGALVGSLRQADAARDVLSSLDVIAERATDRTPVDVWPPHPGPDPHAGPGTAPQVDGPPLERVAASPVIRRLVATTRSMLGVQLAFLSRIDGSRQVFAVVADVEGAPVVAEGMDVDVSDGYCQLMLDEHIPASVPDLRAHPLTASMPVTAATGAVNYCGVPVRLSDGTVYGTLCGLDRDPSLVLTGARLEALRTMAHLVGDRLSLEAQQADQLASERRGFDRLVVGTDSWTVIQPITHLDSGRVAGFEALSRFRETTGAPRPPDEVFGEASRLGLSRRLEHASARSALRLLGALRPGEYLSVNVSPRTVLDPETYALFAAFPSDRLVIELTEQEQVADYPAVLNALAGLRARGARLAIDDTGAGFAGLQHLARLAPDIVKLDISFVRDIDTDPSRRAVARAVIGFAAEVGASLVAEGIETHAELQVLRDLGATHGQGYLLGRPATPATYLGDRGTDLDVA